MPKLPTMHNPSATREAARKAKAGKLGAEKLTPEQQRRRFIEVARKAGASEDEAEFDRRSAGFQVPGSASV
ncbi:hypothetical protein [uncultured Enterovirga sp.]|uniref:hypothetical protein n=1 Tax=uncultured Enterovirga sp. TaxID=2026352 RepID=UPI0035CB5FC3